MCVVEVPGSQDSAESLSLRSGAGLGSLWHWFGVSVTAALFMVAARLRAGNLGHAAGNAMCKPARCFCRAAWAGRRPPNCGCIPPLPLTLHPCVPLSKPPASCSPPHLKGGCESEGRSLKPWFLSDRGQSGMSHATLSLTQCNLCPARASSPLLSAASEVVLAGRRCAGGICCHSQPALWKSCGCVAST